VESRGQVKSATGAQRKRKTTVSKGPRRIVDPRDLQVTNEIFANS